MTVISQSNGFPPGYFIIRSAATRKVLDVAGNFVEDGTEVILWPEKETSLVESRRNREANNQVFFIDTGGALCSLASGHCLDVEGDRLVLRHRRPMTLPYPNRYAHPSPKFSYSPETAEISIHFGCDPSYPPPAASVSDAWKNKSYTLTSIPLRKPRTFIDDASEFLTSTIATPFASIFGAAGATATPEQVANAGIDLAEEEVLDQDRGEEAEVDDSPDEKREVCMLTISDEHAGDLVEQAKLRRRWEIIPLRNVNRRTEVAIT